jgi:hypothetical protein
MTGHSNIAPADGAARTEVADARAIPVGVSSPHAERFAALLADERPPNPRQLAREMQLSDSLRMADSVVPSHASHPMLPAMLVESAPSSAPASPPSQLPALLRDWCKHLYVDSATLPSRVMLALDGALPLAAAEFIREGAYIRLRLHGRDDADRRFLASQTASLRTQLEATGSLEFSIEVASEDDTVRGAT